MEQPSEKVTLCADGKYSWRNLIKVSEPFSKNQVYCRKEDFDFVLGFIRDHCPKMQGG